MFSKIQISNGFQKFKFLFDLKIFKTTFFSESVFLLEKLNYLDNWDLKKVRIKCNLTITFFLTAYKFLKNPELVKFRYF